MKVTAMIQIKTQNIILMIKIKKITRESSFSNDKSENTEYQNTEDKEEGGINKGKKKEATTRKLER